MKTIKLHLLLFIGTCSCLLSCEIGSLSEYRTGGPVLAYRYEFSKIAKKAIVLQEGKYFIYKDTAGGQIDSVIVAQSDLEMIEAVSENWLFGQTTYTFTEKYSLKLSTFRKSFGNKHFNWLSLYAVAGSPAGDTCTMILKSEGDLDVTSVSNQTPVGLTMNVYDSVYHNVIMTESQKGTSADPGHTRTITYWAPGIGIIKRSTITAGGYIRTFNLVRHN